jgi:hypothetical protein
MRGYVTARGGEVGSFRQEERRRKEWEGGTRGTRGKEKKKRGQENGKGIWEERRGGRVLDRRREEGKNGKEEREEKKRKRQYRRMGKVYGRWERVCRGRGMKKEEGKGIYYWGHER